MIKNIVGEYILSITTITNFQASKDVIEGLLCIFCCNIWKNSVVGNIKWYICKVKLQMNLK